MGNTAPTTRQSFQQEDYHKAILMDYSEQERIRKTMCAVPSVSSSYDADESDVPPAATSSSASSSPDSSCHAAESGEESVASVVERLFLDNGSEASTSAKDTSFSTTSRTRRRIIHVYQTYQTSLVPRSRMPQEMIDDLEAQEEAEVMSRSSNSHASTNRSHIPFRKCRNFECKCHDADYASDASSITSVSRGLSKRTSQSIDPISLATRIPESFSSITEDTRRREEDHPRRRRRSSSRSKHNKTLEHPLTPSETEDLVGLLVEPSSNTTPKTKNRKQAKQRARSEDFVDHGAVMKPSRSRSGSFHMNVEATKTKQHPQPKPCKTRCRSEDIIDGDRGVIFTASNAASPIDTALSRTPPTSNNYVARESPTSVSAFPHPEESVKSKEGESKRISHPLEATLRAYRTSIESIRKQHHLPKLERALQTSEVYYQMALIHHQLGRYQTALHVLDHCVEVLIQAAAMAAATAGAFSSSGDIFDDTPDPSHLPLLAEVIPFLSSKALLLVASIFTAQAKIYLAQGLYQTAQQRVEQVMICLGSERQRRRIGAPVPQQLQNTSTAFSLTMARAQVVLGSCYDKLRRPDLAMRCFQDALNLQRYLIGDWQVQVADTLKCLGDLHLSQCMLAPAASCYRESLRVYRYHMASQQEQTGHASSCLTADTATLLTSLGWISLLQHNLSSAWNMSVEALQLSKLSNGKQHRNVASIRYQLGWIHWWSTPAVPRAPCVALSEWKRVLKLQETALKRRRSREEVYQRMNGNSGSTRKKHVDLAKTLHAIGHAYHASGDLAKSRHAMHAAEDIYRVNLRTSAAAP